MGLLDRLFGRSSDRPRRDASPGPQQGGRSAMTADEQAIERYRYLLRTAPPETIEQAHAEAFAQLTPEQRQMVLLELSQDLPESERAAAMRAGTEPGALARTATRAEMRQPGTLERRFGGMGAPGMGMGGMSMGGLMAGSFLSTIAGVVIGSAIADAFFTDSGYDGGDGGEAGADAGDTGDAGYDGGDTGDYSGEEFGSGDFGSGDFGGGDFGGGDFGGGEF